jgi:hypothetical protein
VFNVSSPHPDPTEAESRWELIRDLVVFQLKLALDALRDVLLVPVSLVAGIVDLVSGGEPPGKNFYGVVRLGRGTERWINLFGAVEEPEGEEAVPSLDSLVGQLEHLIVDQVERGGVTASAKDAIDRSLDRITEVSRTATKPEAGATRSPSDEEA